MVNYIIRRCFLMIPTLVGIMTICFFISEFVPGGPIDQVRAKLEGKDGDMGESGSSSSKNKDSKLNSRDEMILLRQFGYHTTRAERYLRTILWFSPDSISSSKELGREKDSMTKEEAANIHDALPFTRGKTQGIIIRSGEDYYAYNTLIPNEEQESAVYFDKTTKMLRGVTNNDLQYDFRTGKCLVGGTSDLAKIEIYFKETSRKHTYTGLMARSQWETILKTNNFPAVETKHTVSFDTLFGKVNATYDPQKEILEKEDLFKEIYIKEPLVQSLFTWDNWHGYFLLKFGKSIHRYKPAYELIIECLPVSMRLGIISFFITYIGCLSLGIFKAVKDGSTFDVISSIVIVAGYSIPGFVLAVLLKASFGESESALLNIFPNGGLHSSNYSELGFFAQCWDSIRHLTMPVICHVIGSFATLTFFTKNNILNETHQLYAVAARARGLSERRVLYKHILRNAFVPLVTGFPASFLMMFFGGSMLIEKIFNLQGIGLLGYDAILQRDFPVVMGNLFMFSFLGLVARLITDICYVIADPRISFDKSNS